MTASCYDMWSICLWFTKAQRNGETFRGRALQITACALQAKIVPPSESCARKESNRPGSTGVHFRACTPQQYCLCPPSVSEISFQDKKHHYTLRLSLKFCAEDLFFVLHPRICGQKARFAQLNSAPPGNKSALPSETRAKKEGKRPT